MDRTPPPVSGTGGGGERSELSIHHTALSDQRNEISAHQRSMCEERARRPNNAPPRVSVYRSRSVDRRSGMKLERSGSRGHSCHCGEAGSKMQRGWSSFADTRQKPIATTSILTRVFSCFSRRCVGGDVHPVGVRRQLNDSQIFGTHLVVTF